MSIGFDRFTAAYWHLSMLFIRCSSACMPTDWGSCFRLQLFLPPMDCHNMLWLWVCDLYLSLCFFFLMRFIVEGLDIHLKTWTYTSLSTLYSIILFILTPPRGYFFPTKKNEHGGFFDTFFTKKKKSSVNWKV
jgi:hypothetical protein